MSIKLTKRKSVKKYTHYVDSYAYVLKIDINF